MKKIKNYIALLITAWFGLYICFVVMAASFNIVKWSESIREGCGNMMVMAVAVCTIVYLIKPDN